MNRIIKLLSDRWIVAVFFLFPAVGSILFFWKERLFEIHFVGFSFFMATSGFLFLLVPGKLIKTYNIIKSLYRFMPVVCFLIAIHWVSSFQLSPGTTLVFPDYFFHFSEFAALGFLMLRMIHPWDSYVKQSPSSTIAAIILSIIFACLDEFHQMFVPGRDASLLDLLSDTLGIITGVSICTWIIKVKAKGETISS